MELQFWSFKSIQERQELLNDQNCSLLFAWSIFPIKILRVIVHLYIKKPSSSCRDLQLESRKYLVIKSQKLLIRFSLNIIYVRDLLEKKTRSYGGGSCNSFY
jgi:hypothetical protein